MIQECLQAAHASPTELRLCGGAAQDEVWSQIIADVTDLPVTCTTDTETGAKGAFMQGTVSMGIQRTFEQAAKDYVQIRQVYEPDRGRAAEYRDLYSKFLAVREHVQRAWGRMEKTGE